MGNRVPQGFSIKSAEHNWVFTLNAPHSDRQPSEPAAVSQWKGKSRAIIAVFPRPDTKWW